MSSVIIAGNTSGSVTLAAPDVAGTTTLTLPATSGTVMVNGAAFSAYASSNQSLTTSTLTKIQINTKIFDTNTNYDNATNYRFTPTVAGYYQVIGRVDAQASGTSTRAFSTIYKNGSEYSRGNDLSATAVYGSVVSSLIYFNGSTDYVELYGFITGATPTVQNGATLTYFQASMVRSA